MDKVKQKSIYSREAETLKDLLKRVRKERKLTQIEVAKRLGRTQSYVSKVEQGEIMIDAVVLFLLCRAMEMPFGEFASRFEAEWERQTLKQIEPATNSVPSSDGQA
jgi:Predicted transcriptional regulator with C-terminal CBS domains